MFRRLRYGLELRVSRRRGHGSLPQDRAWLHPSELPGPFDEVHLPPPRPVLARRFQLAVATTASALLATGGILLAVSATPPAGATTGPKIAPTIAALPASDRSAAGAMLPLVIYEQEHLGTATAMVLPPGDLAVTTTSLPAGASIEGWSPRHHWMSLDVVGRDPALGVTVLRLPVSLPITPTAPLGPAVSTGGAPMTLTALAAIPGATTPIEFEYGPAYFSGAQSAVAVGDSELDITSGKSLAGVISGAIVLNGHGLAVAASVPTVGSSAFVPATFLQLLAQRLVLGDEHQHGWLQLRGADTASGLALVDTVEAHGASWGKVRPGDVIEAVNSQPVHSMAAVDTILYTVSPKTPVTLTILRAGVQRSVSVRLAASP